MSETSVSLRKLKYNLTQTLYDVEQSIAEISGNKPRILFVAPHLSTGGMPQYLYKCIECLLPFSEIFCVEYNNLSDQFTVQRERIQNLLGENYFRLDSEDKSEFLEIINRVYPDVIHFQDFVEFFLGNEICEKIYVPNRPWCIFETCHSSNNKPSDKFWCPDKIVMVNKWMLKVFENSGFELDILEYPIENFESIGKEKAVSLLGLDPTKKHVINVGLFTQGKNQGELIEFAREMTNLPIEFHFVGNLACNFQEYWEPIIQNVPENCRVWGERSDTDLFFQAADLFVFNSVWELNPIVIKESLSWKLPIMMRRLPSYMDDYDNNPIVHYFSSDGEKSGKAHNTRLIQEILGFNS